MKIIWKGDLYVTFDVDFPRIQLEMMKKKVNIKKAIIYFHFIINFAEMIKLLGQESKHPI